MKLHIKFFVAKVTLQLHIAVFWEALYVIEHLNNRCVIGV